MSITWGSLLQGQQVVKDGVGRGSEVEEDIDPKQARKFLQDPSALYTLESDILQPVLRLDAVSGITIAVHFQIWSWSVPGAKFAANFVPLSKLAPAELSLALERQSNIRMPRYRKYDVKDLRCLGGFRNERSDYDWEGFKIELDKTMFPHGKVYEVEVETVSNHSLSSMGPDPIALFTALSYSVCHLQITFLLVQIFYNPLEAAYYCKFEPCVSSRGHAWF